MALESVPEEVLYSVEKLRAHMRSERFQSVKEDEALPFSVQLNWRPSFASKKHGVTHTFDLRADFKLEPSAFIDYILTCTSQKLDVAIWLVVAGTSDSADSEPTGSITLRKKAKTFDLGVCYVSPSTDVIILEKAIPVPLIHNFSSEQIKAGSMSTEMREALELFQSGSWLPALSSLTQTFERAIVKLGHRAVLKSKLTKTKSQFDAMTLHGKIEILANPSFKGLTAADTVLDQAMMRSFLAYKDARNLSNHPTASHAQKRALFDQAVERMITGFRLIKEIEALRVSIR